MKFIVKPLAQAYMQQARERLDNLIKPVGSLGKLERMIIRYAGIRGTAKPQDLLCEKKGVLIFGSQQSMGQIEKLLAEKEKFQVPVEVNVVLAETPVEAMNEGAMLVQEFAEEKNYDMLAFELLDSETVTLNAVAGGMLQAAVMGRAVMLDGKENQRALQLAIKKEPLVENYCLTSDVVQSEATFVQRMAMNFNIFDVALKCYREMQTFDEAGVAKPI